MIKTTFEEFETRKLAKKNEIDSDIELCFNIK